uniref:geranylgeranylglycerol-phosphate geranylgeranyltransferase n=1 Tax=Ornithobacterium rhinotracheale TaxID=28251 RepID=UPI0039A6EB5A
MKVPQGDSYVMKLLALFAVIRGYNVAILVLAMYFAAFFIFAKDGSFSQFFKNIALHCIILSTALTVSAGYIINNFYDLGKDQIARPIMAYLAKFVSQNFKLVIYLWLNFIALIFAFLASWRVAIFIAAFQFLTWLYSHKLNKILFINNVFATILALFPFLALFLYFNNYSSVIFVHGAFLGLNLLTLDLEKDFLTQRADSIYEYQTLPIVLGTRKAKLILNLLLTLTAAVAFLLANFEGVGHMSYYFYSTGIIFLALLPFISKAQSPREWHLLHFILKILLWIGVLSLAWIKINPLDLQKFI